MKKMSFYKILKKPFAGRYMVPWINPLNEDEMLDWERLEVKSKSGGTIIGLFARTKKKAKATIVLGHPIGKEAKAYFLKKGFTHLLRENGYNILVFDMNGFSESTIGNFEFHEDIIAISQRAKKLNPNLPLGYHGISLSGQYGIISFTDVDHLFDFAIIESATTTLEEYWRNFPVAYWILRGLAVVMPSYAKKSRSIEQVEKIRRLQSILFIYSHADKLTPASMGERYLKKCRINAEIWTVEKAKHANIVNSIHKEDYQNKIISFFDKCVKYVDPPIYRTVT